LVISETRSLVLSWFSELRLIYYRNITVKLILVSAVIPWCSSPLPRYYRRVCRRYRHYRGKIFQFVPNTTVLPRITIVPITEQLSSLEWVRHPSQLVCGHWWLLISAGSDSRHLSFHQMMVKFHSRQTWQQCRSCETVVISLSLDQSGQFVKPVTKWLEILFQWREQYYYCWRILWTSRQVFWSVMRIHGNIFLGELNVPYKPSKRQLVNCC